MVCKKRPKHRCPHEETIIMVISCIEVLNSVGQAAPYSIPNVFEVASAVRETCNTLHQAGTVVSIIFSNLISNSAISWSHLQYVDFSWTTEVGPFLAILAGLYAHIPYIPLFTSIFGGTLADGIFYLKCETRAPFQIYKVSPNM